MKKIAFYFSFIISIFLFSNQTSFGQSDNDDGEWETFHSDLLGFKMDYPSDFDIQYRDDITSKDEEKKIADYNTLKEIFDEDKDNFVHQTIKIYGSWLPLVQFVKGEYDVVMDVYIDDLEKYQFLETNSLTVQTPSLEKLADEAVLHHINVFDYQITKYPFEFEGLPVDAIRFDDASDNNYIINIYFMKDDFIYGLQFSVKGPLNVPENLPIFDRMINSFEFLNLNENSTNIRPVENEGVTIDERNNIDDIECGSIITQDIRLTRDLDCISDGLIVLNQDGITIDLNNHSIIGPGTTSGKVGIMIGESENIDVIGNGTIRNYQSGILSTISDNIAISLINLLNNEIGIFSTSSKNSNLENSVYDGNNIGIAIHSGINNSITNNSFTSNERAGITAVKSSENRITSNEIHRSITGIFIDPQSKNNMIDSNVLSQSSGMDLNNANGMSPMTSQNTYINNNCNNSVPTGLCNS